MHILSWDIEVASHDSCREITHEIISKMSRFDDNFEISSYSKPLSLAFVSKKAVDVINACLGCHIEYKEEGGKVAMCEAVKQFMAMGRAEGIEKNRTKKSVI